MDFGLFILGPLKDRAKPVSALIAESAEQVRLAEQIGFTTAWFAEHHLSNCSVCPSPLLMATHCAGLTTTIRLGTAILVLPFYQPVRLVEEIAYVDAMTGGRLVIGVGSGNQDFEARRFDATAQELPSRFAEMLDILELACGDGPLVYEGRHYRIPETELVLRPRRDPDRPFHVAGMAHDPAIAERVARRGYVPFISPQWKPIQAAVEMRRKFEAAFVTSGRPAHEMPLALQRYVYVAESRADALDAVRELRYTQRIAGALKGGYAKADGAWVEETPGRDEPTDEEVLERVIVGSAEECAEKLLRDWRAVRPTHVSCFTQFGGVDGRRALASMERFGRDVMPAVARAIAADATPARNAAAE